MKSWFLGILMFLGVGSGVTILQEAAQYYQVERYSESLNSFRKALGQYPDRSHEIRYNMAQCFYRMDSVDQALSYFHLAIHVDRPRLSAHSLNHIGVLKIKKNQLRQALESFRQALVLDPTLEDARYNYELLKKRLGDPAPKQAPPTPDPSESDNQPEQTPPQPEENWEEPPSDELPVLGASYLKLIEKLRERYAKSSQKGDKGKPISDSLSIEQARSLLDAMRNHDIQFLQQLRKKASIPQKEDRPQW
ncbi:tetratricopeptide repeat protein [Pontibacter sp. G13]|uniref:tetratricopeptide repeat protein n=1 Tax=Pontibacter sp. G13 TaxID=3074898 RepID=UPI0028899381|nr:tetratricopeptide repeat protein [Pontibacter sp. G13]WNJ16905.1 tetratricopeptide repeat protein [Pontibacter sp. G13]